MSQWFYKFSLTYWLRQIFCRVIPTRPVEKACEALLACDQSIRNVYEPIPINKISLIWPIRRQIQKIRQKPAVLTTPDRLNKLAVIVPFRHRDKHLDQLAPILNKILKAQGINFKLFIIEQADDGQPFNRGMVCNIGFDLTKNDFACFCFHDVDMVPRVAEYGGLNQPVLLSNHRVHQEGADDYDVEDNYFGGVVLFLKEHYMRVNGFSNNYRGWGSEDHDLLIRCLYSGLTPCRLIGGVYDLLPHPISVTQTPDGQYHQDEKTLGVLASKVKRNFLMLRKMRRGLLEYKKEGLNTLSYKVISRETCALYEKIKIEF